MTVAAGHALPPSLPSTHPTHLPSSPLPSAFPAVLCSHDTGLPKWFNDDERKFMRPMPQVTGAEFKAAKDELR